VPKTPSCLSRLTAILSLLLVSGLAVAGGYVDSTTPLVPATSIPVLGTNQVLPTFNNAVFNDQLLVSTVSNDTIRTPSTADPVSTVNGNNYHDETDILIKGRGGLNTVFTRTYNSGATAADGPLGYGWTHSYAMRLKSNDHGDCPNCPAGSGAGQRPENGNNVTASVTYTDERGGEHLYKVNESTKAVTAPMGEFDTLVLDSPTGTHTLTFRNGVKYVFETVTAGSLNATPGLSARLKSIADPYGNVLTMAYDTNGRLWKVTDNLALAGRTGLVFTYDGAGHLNQIVDWTNRTWHYVVDASGNLSTYTNPLTQSITYGYTAGSHNLTTIAKPLRGVMTTFSYYKNGKTFNYKNALGHTETLDYDLYRKSTRVTDPRGGIRRYEYSGDTGAMTKLVEPDGAILLFENTPEGLRNKKYDALGYATTYSYRVDRAFTGASDASGNVTREQDATGKSIDTDYDLTLYDQPTHIKDKRGVDIYNDYYATTAGDGVRGRLQRTRIGQITVDGVVYSNVTLVDYTYWPDGNLKRKTEYLDPANAAKVRVTDYTWQDNGLNLLRTVVSASGVSIRTEATYDSLGRQKTETLWRRTSPANAAMMALATTRDYDAIGRVTQVTDPAGHKVETLFDANGQVSEVWEHRRQANASYVDRRLALKEYDAADRLVRQTDVLNNVTQYGYDEAGNLTTQTDGEGRLTRFEYDAMNRRISVTDAQGRKTRTGYDQAGHPIVVTDPLNRSVGTDYDALGRPVRITDPLGFITEMSYDFAGNLTCLTDANAQAGLIQKNSHGCSEFREYDELNRLIAVTDAMDGRTVYALDLLGNIVKLTDAETHIWQFPRDGLGRQIGLSDPLSLSENWQIDEAGNRWQLTDRKAQVSNYTFDSLNRLSSAAYAGGLSENWTYDAFGDLVAIADSQGIGYGFAYDDGHRLTGKTDQRLNRSLSFEYDRSNRLKRKTDYQGDVTSYQFDASGVLAFETNPAYLQVAYHYDGAGGILDRILSSGAKTRYGRDGGGRLSSLTNTSASGAMVTSQTYSRDRVGNITTQTDAGQSTTYGYDALYRLTSVDSPGTANDETYTYDKVGNRKTRIQGGVTQAYDYDAGNRLKAIYQNSLSGTMLTAYVWDANGSLTKQCSGGTVTRTASDCTGSQVRTFGWDGKNRLAWASVPGKPVNTYQYDSRNFRIQKTDSQGNQTFLLEGEHLEAVYSGSNLKAKYLRGAVIDEVVSGYQFDSSGNWTNATFHHDSLQSVVGLSGHDGTVLRNTAYSAFGATSIESGTLATAQRYTGREWDADTGCYQYRARYYCSEEGRFISRDPIGFGGGVNDYVYAGNDPINELDPTGLNGQAAASWALSQVGSTNYRFQSPSPESRGRLTDLLGGAASNKCNYFVWNALTAGGNPPPRMPDGRIPGAQEWSNPDVRIPGYVTISDGSLKLGDVVASATSNGYYHVGLYAPLQADSTSSLGTVSAAAGLSSAVVHNDWGFRDGQNPTVRRWAGDTLDAFPSLKIAPNAPTYRGTSNETPFPSLNLDTNFGSMSGADSSAAGGFLLYPNKPNTNQMQSVYRK
jgi:RHS repeat-associated protein